MSIDIKTNLPIFFILILASNGISSSSSLYNNKGLGMFIVKELWEKTYLNVTELLIVVITLT